MRFRACAILLLMSSAASTQTSAASLSDLTWMVGPWVGTLGPQRVEEAWNEARGGTMATMVRLSGDGATHMIELIVIREEAGSLVLHLRQFSPALELRLAQDMPLQNLGDSGVEFAGPEGAAIKALAYRNVGPLTMEVDVTVADGTVVTAALTRRDAAP